MSIVQTVLVFVGIPALVVGLLAVLTLVPGGGHRRVRYRPGEPWDHEPVWYIPQARPGAAAAGSAHAAVGRERPALGRGREAAPAGRLPAGPTRGAAQAGVAGAGVAWPAGGAAQAPTEQAAAEERAAARTAKGGVHDSW